MQYKYAIKNVNEIMQYKRLKEKKKYKILLKENSAVYKCVE